MQRYALLISLLWLPQNAIAQDTNDPTVKAEQTSTEITCSVENLCLTRDDLALLMAARAFRDEGLFALAIKRYEALIAKHPQSSLVQLAQAERQCGALVRRSRRGLQACWPASLDRREPPPCARSSPEGAAVVAPSRRRALPRPGCGRRASPRAAAAAAAVELPRTYPRRGTEGPQRPRRLRRRRAAQRRQRERFSRGDHARVARRRHPAEPCPRAARASRQVSVEARDEGVRGRPGRPRRRARERAVVLVRAADARC